MRRRDGQTWKDTSGSGHVVLVTESVKESSYSYTHRFVYLDSSLKRLVGTSHQWAETKGNSWEDSSFLERVS